VDQTGTLALGDYVFLATAARVTAVTAKLGGPVGGPVLTASATARQVTVNLDAPAIRGEGRRPCDDHPAGQPDHGGKSPRSARSPPPLQLNGSNGSSSTPTITVQITPTDPRATGTLDQAPVQVAITTATVHNVLACRSTRCSPCPAAAMRSRS